MSNISYKQFKRTYPGSATINFATALSGKNDFDVKTYSNFYLTDKFLLSDIATLDTSTVKVQEIATSIRRGTGSTDYLVFEPPDVGDIGFNYGLAKFNNVGSSVYSSASTFHIQLFNNNICRIYFILQYRRFFLCLDNQNKIFFVKEPFLPNNPNAINPQDFTYLFSTGNVDDPTIGTDNGLLLFKDTQNGFFFIKHTTGGPNNRVSDLIAEQVTSNNIASYTDNALRLSRDLYYYPIEDFDFSFITYKDDNTIDFTKSAFDLRNNFLLHKKYSEDGPTDIIVLKNQLHQNDVFSSSNNLLSSTDPNALFVDDMREYTALCSDIKEEISSELELNYVFFNKTYEIKPGKTEFRAPSSLFPFTQLGINDTKFIDSGAFSYITPEFADKVYRLSNQKQNLDAGQYLLCTWLSGSIYGDKVWMDRYFYPDLIKKEEAITLKPFLAPTYEDVIENLIQVNSTLRRDLLINPIFDKISDMVFEPNQVYVYERLQVTEPLSSVTQVTKCDVVTSNIPVNYFENLNKAGAFTMYLTFDGDDKSWTVFSDRNTIDAGIIIRKTKTDITISYTLFDQTGDTQEGVTGSNKAGASQQSVSQLKDKYREPFEKTVKFKPLKVNHLAIGINTIKGEVYFTVNNELFSSDRGHFLSKTKVDDLGFPAVLDIHPYEFTYKNILFGDFFIDTNSNNARRKNANLLLFDSFVRDFQIFDEFLEPDLAFAVPILNGDIKIDTIYITLPCGQRNSIDNIELLQHICASSSFKSNNINILLKNLNIDSEDVIQSIKNTIISNVDEQIPASTTIKEIKTENYL